MHKLNNIPFKLPIVSYNGGGGGGNSNSSSTSTILTILDGSETLEDEMFKGESVETFTLTSSQTFVIIQRECGAQFINLAPFSSYGNINLTFINNGETTSLKVSSNNNFFVYIKDGVQFHDTFELPEDTTTILTITYDKTTSNYRCYSLT